MEISPKVISPDSASETEVKTGIDSPATKDFLKIADFFGVDDRKISIQDEHRLKEIYDWCKDDSEAEMFNKLVTKRNELGSPRLDETRLFQMYKWLVLNKEFTLAKDNLVKFETGHN